MKINFIWTFIFILFCSTLSVSQNDFEDVVITSDSINDHLFMLQGAGGNILISAGEDGVIMIDDQFADLSEKIKIKIKELTHQEVSFLVNTHWHGDHTGGNENFGKDGAVIIAHENVRERMQKGLTKLSAGREIKPAPRVALPVITFTEDLKLHLNGDDIHLFHFHNGHTDGDGIVFFPQLNVIHMGDTFFKDRYPYIDLRSGGSVDGLLKTISNVFMLINEETVIVPGHGSLANKEDLQRYFDLIQGLRDEVKTMKEKGLNQEEIEAANITSKIDDSWGSGFINAEKFVGFLIKSEPLD